MAIGMLLGAREHAAASIDRYVVFTDTLKWRAVPDWLELIQLHCPVSGDREENWSIKPLLLSHPEVANDLLLYIDSDTTIYKDIIGRCFEWIREHSLLVYMDFIPSPENWGPVNLRNVYSQAGYDVQNLKINSGIIGRAPDVLGKTMQRLYGDLLGERRLKPFFADSMYQKNDEPYLGLAVQLAYRECGLRVAERLHDLSVQDYALTIAADPRMFRAKPGPVLRVAWYPEDIVRPSVVHWVSSTQYWHYRTVLWSALRKGQLLNAWWPVLVRDEFKVLLNRVRLKLRGLGKRFQ